MRPALALLVPLFLINPVHAQKNDSDVFEPPSKSSGNKHKHLKKPQKGKASYYGTEFFGRKMADGTRMDPTENIAASRSLPLGTQAKVTNLENGKSEVVEIRDRGPYVAGRIVDVTPNTAEKLGFKKDGVAPVEVTPLKIPDRSESRN